MRYVWRYNPDSQSRRAVRVRADSPEAQEWPSRKPRRLTRAEERALERAVIPVAAPVLQRATRGVSRGAAAVRAVVTPAPGLVQQAGGKAALVAEVAGAFAIGYAIGTALRKGWQYLSKEERASRAASAFREARAKFERDYGRPPNLQEVRELGKGMQWVKDWLIAESSKRKG